MDSFSRTSRTPSIPSFRLLGRVFQIKSKSSANIENAVKIAKENPKIAGLIFVAVAGYIYRTSGSNYTSPWLDGRKIDSGLNTKQLLKTDFKPELAENIKWDVIIIGSGLDLICENFASDLRHL